ncbi:transcription initiation factor TFIID subunit 4-like [Patiria miniata]|uniref:TAFH domain-containing protein n=1 Tax=Patiria miniata TaxID=46514 RepID=A0A914AZX5_PATMI|nr:transcription initiation factor TFIID subunit 4-like [Patiria miniata]
MAGTTSIEDILSSVVDETAVSALIGSLESKLAAGNTVPTSSSLDTASVGSNHVSKPGVTSGDGTGNSTHPNASQINAGQDGPSAVATVPVVVTAASQQPSSGNSKALDNLAPTASGTTAAVQNSNESKPSTGVAVRDGNCAAIALNSASTPSSPGGGKLTTSSVPTPTTCVRVITLPATMGGTVFTTTPAGIAGRNSSNNNAVKSAVLESNARTVVKTVGINVQQQGKTADVTQTGLALTTVTSSVLSSGSSPSTGISGQKQVNTAQASAQNTVAGHAGSLSIREHLTSTAKQPIKTAIVAPTPHQTVSNVNTSTTQPQIVLRPAPTLQVQSPNIIKSNASSSSVVTIAATTVSQVKLPIGVTSGMHNVITASPQVQQVRLASPQVIAPRTPGGTAVQFRLPQGTSLPPGVMLINKDGNIHAVVNSSIGPGGQIQHLPSGTVPGAVTYRQVQPGSTTLQRPSPQPTTVVQSSIRPNMGQLMNTTNATISQLKGATPIVVGGAPGSPSVSMSSQGVQGTMSKMVGVSTSGSVPIQRAAGGTPIVGQPVVGGAQPQPIPMSQSAMENVKKCRNFLTTLIKLASNGNQPAETVKNVKELVQNLIDGKTEPEEFTSKLQKELKSSPQPYLIPFLKKSLPLLRQTLQKGGSLQIQGLSAPTMTAAQTMNTSSPAATGTLSSIVASQPTLLSTLATGSGKTTTLNLTPQQLQQLQQHQAAKNKQQNMKMPQLPTFAQKSKAQTVATTSSSKSSSSSHSSSSRSSQSKSHSSKSSSKSSSSSSSSKKDKVKDHSSSGFKDDDDINDVTSMAGVNLSEESARILATNADFIGTQLRSIKEEKFLFSGPLQSRVNEICVKHGIQEASTDMMELVSHAAQERLKGLVEKLGVIARHRMEVYRNDSRYEVTSDVRSQLKFFEQLDSLERKRRDEQERELLLRAAKSRSKQEDPEQARLKQKAKEMQQMELEQIRQQEANMTALAAIGPRKKRKLDSPTPGSSSGSGSSSLGAGGSSGSPSVRSQIRRIKRVNFRDLIFLMEQEQEMKKSQFFFKMFFK